MIRPRMPESHPGQWCLTAEPSRQVPGVLKIDESGRTSLELIGELEDSWSSPQEHSSAEKRIFGIIAASNGVTLNGCFVIRTEGLFGSAVKQVWHANEAIFGAQFDSEEPWAFYAAAFEMPALTTWVQRARHDFIIEHDADNRVSRLGIAANIESWPLWTFKDGKAELRRIVRTAQPFEGVTEFEALTLCQASFATTKAADDFHNGLVRPLQVLLGLATTQFTTPVASQVCVEPPEADGKSEYVRWQREPVEIEFNPLKIEFAFHYSDFAALDTAPAWVGSHAKFDPVWSLYLSALRRSGPLEMQFLFVIQALEAYHRLSNASSTPTSTRKVKDPILRDRLLDLLQRLGPSVDAVCGPSLVDFVSLAVKARNHFTHWDTAKSPRPLGNEELVYLTWRLLTVLELSAASLVGFQSSSAAWGKILARRIQRIPPKMDTR